MVFLRSFSIILVLLILSSIPSFAENTWATRDGYYIDNKGSIQNSYMQPPHPENIPTRSQAIKPIADFEDYYKMNAEGYRGREDKLPLVPGYTENFSTRTAQLYSKEAYINVWCDGEKHVGKVDCLTDNYAISFFPLSSWTRGITTAAWRAKKLPQQGMATLYVDDTASQSSDMYEAKRWAEKWGVKVSFVTIDAGIPEEWIP